MLLSCVSSADLLSKIDDVNDDGDDDESECCFIAPGGTGEAGYTGATGASGPANAAEHTGPEDSRTPCEGPIGEPNSLLLLSYL